MHAIRAPEASTSTILACLALYDEAFGEDKELTSAQVYQLILEGSYDLVVAKVPPQPDTSEEVVLGFALVAASFSHAAPYLEPKLRIGHLDYLAVSSRARGLGIGTRLFRYLVDSRYAATLDLLTLQCDDSKIAFYEKLGCSLVVGREPFIYLGTSWNFMACRTEQSVVPPDFPVCALDRLPMHVVDQLYEFIWDRYSSVGDRMHPTDDSPPSSRTGSSDADWEDGSCGDMWTGDTPEKCVLELAEVSASDVDPVNRPPLLSAAEHDRAAVASIVMAAAGDGRSPVTALRPP